MREKITIPVCRVAGCKRDADVAYGCDKDVQQTPVAPMNHGMCRAHVSSMPIEIRKRIAVASTQSELDAAFADAWAIGWRAPDDAGTWKWFSMDANTDLDATATEMAASLVASATAAAE